MCFAGITLRALHPEAILTAGARALFHARTPGRRTVYVPRMAPGGDLHLVESLHPEGRVDQPYALCSAFVPGVPGEDDADLAMCEACDMLSHGQQPPREDEVPGDAISTEELAALFAKDADDDDADDDDAEAHARADQNGMALPPEYDDDEDV